jgi:hypothetical protein
MFKVSNGNINLQLQRFLQFLPVIGSRELEEKAVLGNIPAGARGMGGCYRDQ